MEFVNILTEIKDGICLITINNPKKLNALDTLTVKELHTAMDWLENDNSVRVVLLTGAGKAFIAGADIALMSTFTPEEARQFAVSTNGLCRKMKASKKVYIAVINGYALGGGFEIALGCDILLVAETAVLGLPEVGLGVLPGGGGTQRLTRLVGTKKAMELILTGDRLNAQEAHRIGLVNQIVPQEELVQYAYNMAGRITKNAPMAVRYAKECINKCDEANIEVGLDFENIMWGLCFTTADQQEGMEAFIEKRQPQFSLTLQ